MIMEVINGTVKIPDNGARPTCDSIHTKVSNASKVDTKGTNGKKGSSPYYLRKAIYE